MIQFLRKLTQNKILKSSAGILAITFIIKIFGYLEKLLLAKYFGTSSIVDIYTVTITIVLSLFFFFREIVEPGFLNVFLDARNKGEEKESWKLFNKGLRIILLITFLISVFSFLFPQAVIILFAPGFEGEKLKLSIVLIKIAIPACIFFALSTLPGITLNGLKIFVLPASGELVFKGFIIIFMILLHKEYGIIGATVGILVGSIGRFGLHLVKLYKNISIGKISVKPEYKQRAWQLTWPLLIGVSFSQFSSLIDNVFASYLQDGSIAALSYAKKVVELPIIVFPYVISVVIFPYFAQLNIEQNTERLKDLLASSLKWIIIGFLPIAAFFFIYSTQIVEIIFQRGAFDANSTILTAKPLMIYSFGMVFFAIETILVIFYYANGDTQTPVFVGIACVILNIVLTWIFIQIMGYAGIALGFVLQKVIKNIILLYKLKQKISYNIKSILMFLIPLLLSFTAFLALISFSKISLFSHFSHTFISKAGFIALSFVIAGIMYVFMLQKSGIIENKRLKQNETI
jgi:putative peptidoglycan lipid II flippase